MQIAGLSEGLIFDIKKYSIHDGPGIRTTVFLKGCPLCCAWCHNPESQVLDRQRFFREERCIRCGACVEACEQAAIAWNGDGPVTADERCTLCGDCVAACYAGAREIVGQAMTVAQVLDQVERDVTFYDESGGGVTISGGEPLMQPDFLRALLAACQARGIHTALDTCGYAPWEVLENLIGLVDLFLYDLKLVDDARHREFTGVSNRQILDNLEALSRRVGAGQGYRLVLRVPLIPGVNDRERDLCDLGAYAAALPHLHGVDLLPYHATAAPKYERLGWAYGLGDVHSPSPADIARAEQVLAGFGLKVHVGG